LPLHGWTLSRAATTPVNSRRSPGSAIIMASVMSRRDPQRRSGSVRDRQLRREFCRPVPVSRSGPGRVAVTVAVRPLRPEPGTGDGVTGVAARELSRRVPM
jgi:hypothetical protein